jgi:tetratricopeptide (TPR) repeat protein
MAVKNIKKELKEPDKFLVFLNNSLKTIKDNKNIILGALCIILIVFFAGYGVSFYSKTKEKNAYILLESINNIYAQEVNRSNFKEGFKEGFKERFDKTSADFEKLLKKFKSTKAGKIGVIEYADAAYNAEHFDIADEYYKKALDIFRNSDLKLQNIILIGMAHTKYQKKEYKEAEYFFQKIIESDSEILKDDALFGLGILNMQQGNKEAAKKLFEKIANEHKNSMYKPFADNMI